MQINLVLRRIPFSVRFFAGTLAVVIAGTMLVAGLTFVGYQQAQVLLRKIDRDFESLQSLSEASANLSTIHIDIQKLLEDAGEAYDEEAVYARGSAAIAGIENVIEDLQEALLRDSALLAYLNKSTGYRDPKELIALVSGYRSVIVTAIEMTSVDLKLARRELVDAGDEFNKTTAVFTGLIKQYQNHLDDEIQRSYAGLVRALLWWGVPVSLIVVVVLLGSWLMAKQLSDDLGQILTSMRRFGAGNTDVAIPDLRGDKDLAPIVDALEVFRSAMINLRRSHADLEDKVRERTQELEKAVIDLEREMKQRAEAESRLRQAQKMQSLGNLAGGLAHEINNLLLPILALSQMTLKQFPEGSRDAQRLQKIIEASERAKELVAQVMAFGREDEAKMELVDLYSIIRETMKLLYKTLLSTITVRQNLDETTGNVWADAAQIGAVVMNVVSNAQDAFEGDKGEIDVSLGPVEVDAGLADRVHGLQTGPYAKLSVADHGKGMDGDTLKRVFDPFFTTKAVGKGKGLGLSMVYGIVNKHGGAVDLKSTLGAGTTVDVYLPLIRQQTA